MIIGWGNRKASWWRWHLKCFQRTHFRRGSRGREAVIWVCMKAESQWNSSWAWGRWMWGLGVWWRRGVQDQRDGEPFSSLLPSWSINRREFIKGVFKFSNLILARSYPMTLLFPECPQGPFPIKPGGRLRLSASLDEPEPVKHFQLGITHHGGGLGPGCAYTCTRDYLTDSVSSLHGLDFLSCDNSP